MLDKRRSPVYPPIMGKRSIMVRGTEVTIVTRHGQDSICLTDMLLAKDGEFFIADWLRNRNTVEFLGIWESVHNPDFSYGGFAIIRSQVGLNSFEVSVKEWLGQTHAIGLFARAGRYGGTYAHPDIAFEFGMWVSPAFKVWLVKEFRRLKEVEVRSRSSTWSMQRTLAKVNYRIHTDAMKEHLVPPALTKHKTTIRCASEADLLNVALFGMAAAEWRTANPGKEGNGRGHATLEQLVVLSNLESINAMLVHQGLAQQKRLVRLNATAITQMRWLVGKLGMRRLGSGK